jgi:uncharacterized protein YabN with tetrapyrrole methylase and pyrophosphatase domain
MKRAAEAGICRADAGEALADCLTKLKADMDERDFGEALMALCDFARLKGIDPEIALNAASDRFISNFEKLEAWILSKGDNFDGSSSETLREYWNLVKL